MNRVYGEWRNRVRAEYRSAAITAGVLHAGIAVGLPRELLDMASRIVTDELDHAELSQECLLALGGPDDPATLDVRQLAPQASGEGVFADLLDAVLQSFCLGETFAVPLFAAMRKGTTHPAVEPMLTRVLRDETVHRQFGWDVLDVLIAMDPPGVRQRAERRLPELVDGFRRAYGEPAEAPPTTEEEQGMGLLPAPVYVRVYTETLANTIRPWFLRREIHLPEQSRG